MNIATIEVSEEEAATKLAEYEASVVTKRSAWAVDEELLRAYRAVAKGGRVLHLSQAIRSAPTVEKEIERSVWRTNDAGGQGYVRRQFTVALPGLAIARVFSQGAAVTVYSDGRVVYSTNPNSRAKDVRVSTEAGVVSDASQTLYEFAAQTPIVPPAIRPTRGIGQCHILWEADWVPVADVLPPPRDPFLLRHIAGQLYAILGEWDLTEMERAVIAGQRL